MQLDTRSYVRYCHSCQLLSPNITAKAVGVQAILERLHTFLMVFAGPLLRAKDGIKYLLVFVEHLEGCSIMRAVGSETLNVPIKFFQKEIMGPTGSPAVIFTGNGPAFFLEPGSTRPPMRVRKQNM